MLNLRNIRRQRKITLAELARKVGTTGMALSRYEREQRKMPVEIARKLAEILDVNWWELYG